MYSKQYEKVAIMVSFCALLLWTRGTAWAKLNKTDIQKIKSEVCQGKNNCSVLNIKERVFKYTNKRVILVKVDADGQSEIYRLDETFKALHAADVVNMDRLDRQAKFKKYGRKAPRLFNYLSKLRQAHPNARTPVAIWLETPIFDFGDKYDDATSCTGDQLDCDLDIRIYDVQSGQLVASSTSWDNSYEFVKFHGDQSHVYRIEIHGYSFRNSTYMALAFVSLAN